MQVSKSFSNIIKYYKLYINYIHYMFIERAAQLFHSLSWYKLLDSIFYLYCNLMGESSPDESISDWNT